MAGAEPSTRSQWMRRWSLGLLLFITVLSGYLLAFNVDKPTHNADWYIRYQVSCSIVERNDFQIRSYQIDGRTGPGLGGRTYSEYTLGQTTGMIPLYLLGRALSGLSHTNCDRIIAPPIVFLTAKSFNFVVGALLVVLFFATARLLGYARRLSLSLSLLLAFGTSLWPDVLSSEEHTLESLFLLAAVYAALRYTLREKETRLWVLVMGLVVGLVFVTRVAGIIAVVPFALYLVAAHRRWRPEGWKRPCRRDLLLYAVGLLPSLLINAIFDFIRFGSPLQTGAKSDPALGYFPVFGVANLLISPGKGLFFYAPALLLLPFVVRPFWRRSPLPAILFALIGFVYLLFYANVTYWHGDPSWGPRYLYPLLPYGILPLGELWRRWYRYILPVRIVAVGLLACSFLVQFSAVTVSYWRHWHFIYGYHYDQVENHGWGQNLNYWWIPDQSPLWISLSGLADISQKYADRYPLLAHPAAERYSNPVDSCQFLVYRKSYLCLTDADDYQDNYSWNTITLWWLHSYPWWSRGTVLRLAALLAALFVGGLEAITALVVRRDRADLSLLAQEADPQDGASRIRPAVGLRPIVLGATYGALLYGVIVDVAILDAPRRTPPLIHMATTSTTIEDGYWRYQILGVTRLTRLPGPVGRPLDALHEYAVVRIRLYNAGARPAHIRLEQFALTDAAGSTYPLAGPRSDGLRMQVAELYHLTPFGMQIPPRSSLDGVLAYVVRTSSRHLQMLGPGISLVQLNG